MSEYISSGGRGASATGDYDVLKQNQMNNLKNGHSNSVAQGGNQNLLRFNGQHKNHGTQLHKQKGIGARNLNSSAWESSSGQFVKLGTRVNDGKMQRNINDLQNNIVKSAILDENILKQIDKTFVLCIDPETRLPFMINMGLKIADVCDLDNRPSLSANDQINQNNQSADPQEYEENIQIQKANFPQEKITLLLEPRNYPFYYKNKRNLYIIEQLLNDENNLQFLGSKESDQIQNSEMNAYQTDSELKSIRGRSPKEFSQSSLSRSKGGSYGAGNLFQSSSFACSTIMKWSFKNNPNAEAFRRNMLPFYLLKDDSGWKHPRYIEYSNLSQNLNQNPAVSFTIYVSYEIQEEIDKVLNYIASDNNNMAVGMGISRKQTAKLFNKTKTFRKQQRQPIRINNFCLLKTAQTLIDEAVEQMHLKHFPDLQNASSSNQNMANGWANSNQAPQLKKNNDFKQSLFARVKVLKFKNLEAYIYGQTQLIYFSDIRESIKNNQLIELVLYDIDGDENNKIIKSITTKEHSLMNKNGRMRQNTLTSSNRSGPGGNLNQPNNQYFDAVNTLAKFSINQQMKIFPPMVNTLYLEKETENEILIKYQKFQNKNQIKNPIELNQEFEKEIKSKLIDTFINASSFYWYPPADLLNERYLQEKERKISENQPPQIGISYTKPSTDKIFQQTRSKIFNNNYAHQNIMKASWRSIKSDQNKFYYLKSGQLEQDFKIKLHSIGNLIKIIDDLYTGNNTIHDIYQYKYVDTWYEAKYGHDIILDNEEAKLRRKQLKIEENQDNKKDYEIVQFLNDCQSKYEKECKSILNNNQYLERVQQNQKVFNYQNFSSNIHSLTKTFRNQNFNVISNDKKKKKATSHNANSEQNKKTIKINPLYVQVEAALYLGCERISQFSYSKPQLFAQNVYFDQEELYFCSITDNSQSQSSIAAQMFSDKAQLKVSNIPSNTRLVIQIILLPQTFSFTLTQRNLPN